jgi:hypothetical protein
MDTQGDRLGARFASPRRNGERTLGMGNYKSKALAWLGAIAASATVALAFPSNARAQTISICVTQKGLIKGINTACQPDQTLLSWPTIGPAGPTGPTGPTGPQGPQGANGEVGPVGIQGPTGSQGPAGTSGSVGSVGVAGVTGPQGPQGIRGPAGPTGAPGSPGVAGASGVNGLSTVNAVMLTGGTQGSAVAKFQVAQLTPANTLPTNGLWMPFGGVSFAAATPLSPAPAKPLNIALTPLLGGASGTAGGDLGHFQALISSNPGLGGAYDFEVCVFNPDLSLLSCAGLCSIADSAVQCSNTAGITGVPAGGYASVVAYADPTLVPTNSVNVGFSMTYTHN